MGEAAPKKLPACPNPPFHEGMRQFSHAMDASPCQLNDLQA